MTVTSEGLQPTIRESVGVSLSCMLIQEGSALKKASTPSCAHWSNIASMRVRRATG
jgi:hypothetical protein